MSNDISIGTVLSDEDTPTFETVRIKLRTGQEVRPGTLVRIPLEEGNTSTALIGRIKSAYEHNPNESPEDINVRDTLGLQRNYPDEKDSTVIYRLVEADLIEQFDKEGMHAPESLPRSGAEVYIANSEEIVKALGTMGDEKNGLNIGYIASGTQAPIILKRESIQRHFFLCGTTGSGKSYAMGVIMITPEIKTRKGSKIK
jgi:Helicase HerA, central domain